MPILETRYGKIEPQNYWFGCVNPVVDDLQQDSKPSALKKSSDSSDEIQMAISRSLAEHDLQQDSKPSAIETKKRKASVLDDPNHVVRPRRVTPDPESSDINLAMQVTISRSLVDRVTPGLEVNNLDDLGHDQPVHYWNGHQWVDAIVRVLPSQGRTTGQIRIRLGRRSTAVVKNPLHIRIRETKLKSPPETL